MTANGNTIYLTGVTQDGFAPLQGGTCQHFHDVINGFSSTSDPGYVSDGFDAFLTIIDENNFITFNTFWGGSRDANAQISDAGFTVSTGINGDGNQFFVLFGGKTRSLDAGLNNTIPVCHESPTSPYYFNPDLIGSPEIFDGFISKIYLDDCLVVGTNESKTDVESFLLMPNPATERVSLMFDQGYKIPNSICIFDASGKECSRLTGSCAANGYLDVRRLPPGLYFVRLEYEDRLLIGRFIKM